MTAIEVKEIQFFNFLKKCLFTFKFQMHKQTRRELETAYNKGKKMNNDNNR